MSDVAARAGVSIATVSRALSGAAGIRPTTRERVRRAATELSYVVSPEASRLARGVTGRVGVVVPAIHLWYYASILAGIEGVLREAELDLLLYHVENSADRQQFFERLPARRKVDALVVVAFPLTADQRKRLDLLGVSVVLAGQPSRHYAWAGIDDEGGARMAVNHLIHLGHERVAMIQTHDRGNATWTADRNRLAGFRAALRDAGLPVEAELTVTVPWGMDGGARAMDRLLGLARPPTAVFAFSDEMAIGALRSLRRTRIEVPGAISVVGFDDHPMADLTDLTTVAQPSVEIGRRAAATVLRLLGGSAPDLPAAAPGEYIPTQLVVRGTTGPPAAGAPAARTP